MTTETPKAPEEFRVKNEATGIVDVYPNLPQSEVLVSRALITIMQAGAQSGKTSVGAFWLKSEMEERGPGDYMFVAPTFPLMEPRALPELKAWFGEESGWGQYRVGFHRFESYELRNGQPAYRIFLGSAVNPDSLESATIKACWIDEIAQSQFPRSSWEAIQRRVSLANGRILGTTTLYDVSGWYRNEIYERWKEGDPRINIIQADSIANPNFSREAYENARATMPYWKFNMAYRGIYEKPTGIIYDCFREDDQIISRFAIDPEWPRFVGHDFGPNNTAALWMAQDPGTSNFYVYRGYWQGGRTVGQHAEEWKRLSQGEKILTRSGGSHQEEEIRYAYTAAGWPIREPKIQSVEAGIDRAYSFVSGHLFVFSDQHDFLNELLTYTRELDDNYEATDKITGKQRFHLMDCMRYMLSNFAPERTGGSKEAIMKVKDLEFAPYPAGYRQGRGLVRVGRR